MTVEGSRFTLTEAATLLPGTDFVTKSPMGPFVDTGYTTSFADGKQRNRVYLSVDTVRELAEVAGLFEPLRAQIQQAHDDGYDEGYNVGIKENFNADLTDAVDRLDLIADSLRVFRPEPVAAEPVAAAGAGSDDGAAAVTEIQPARAERAARQSRRPTRQQGRADVSADPADEGTIGV